MSPVQGKGKGDGEVGWDSKGPLVVQSCTSHLGRLAEGALNHGCSSKLHFLQQGCLALSRPVNHPGEKKTNKP